MSAAPVDRRRSFAKWCEKNAELVLAEGDGAAGDEALAAVVLDEARALADGSHFTADFGPAEAAALGQDMDFMLRTRMLRAPVNLKELLRPGRTP